MGGEVLNDDDKTYNQRDRHLSACQHPVWQRLTANHRHKIDAHCRWVVPIRPKKCQLIPNSTIQSTVTASVSASTNTATHSDCPIPKMQQKKCNKRAANKNKQPKCGRRNKRVNGIHEATSLRKDCVAPLLCGVCVCVCVR